MVQNVLQNENVEFKKKYIEIFLVWSDQTHELHMEQEWGGTDLLTLKYLSECESDT